MTPRTASAYVHGAQGPVVVVPARVCAWLHRAVDLQRLRIDHRGEDAEVDAVLVALTVAALGWPSGPGSPVDAPPEVEPPSETMTATAAAEVLDITSRAVRMAITDGRLPAELEDGRWKLQRHHVERFATTRRPT